MIGRTSVSTLVKDARICGLGIRVGETRVVALG